jgi:hypothetical protein
MYSYRTIISIVFVSSLLGLTHANNYSQPISLLPRQSSRFCPSFFVQFPAPTDSQCGSGYITNLCTCCSDSGMACYTLTQTCAQDAYGNSICCDNGSPNCGAGSGGSGGGSDCPEQGLIPCGGSCCPSDHTCCNAADGTYMCCGSDDNNNNNNSDGSGNDSASTPSPSAPTPTGGNGVPPDSTSAATSTAESQAAAATGSGRGGSILLSAASANVLLGRGGVVAIALVQIGLGISCF